MKRCGAILASMILASNAHAEVKSASAAGFDVVETTVSTVSPKAAFTALAELPRWWDSHHTLSGSAANLSLEPRAGGCFCEALPDGGSARFMVVELAAPPHLLRLRGLLGPLATEAAEGVLTFTIKPAASGAELTVEYLVSGALRPSGEAFAGPVDHVLQDQLTRLRRYAETGSPASPSP